MPPRGPKNERQALDEQLKSKAKKIAEMKRYLERMQLQNRSHKEEAEKHAKATAEARRRSRKGSIRSQSHPVLPKDIYRC
mgnify:CR=1 FL=1